MGENTPDIYKRWILPPDSPERILIEQFFKDTQHALIEAYLCETEPYFPHSATVEEHKEKLVEKIVELDRLRTRLFVLFSQIEEFRRNCVEDDS